MNIGIIGAGMIGGTLTQRFAQLGHDVAVANSRGPETLADLARETRAQAVTVRQAARGKDVVVITIPLGNVAQLPAGLLDELAPDAAVIDTNNYYPERDGKIAEIEDGMPESRWVERQLNHAVVKAFNNIQARHLREKGRPQGNDGRIALPVAGDEPEKKAVVMQLIDQLGFDPVDAGGIDQSWRQQPGTPCYIADFEREALIKALAAASPVRRPAWRAKN